jgi:hypothetical protein
MGSYGSLGVGWVADGERVHGFHDGALDRFELLARHEQTRSRCSCVAPGMNSPVNICRNDGLCAPQPRRIKVVIALRFSFSCGAIASAVDK